MGPRTRTSSIPSVVCHRLWNTERVTIAKKPAPALKESPDTETPSESLQTVTAPFSPRSTSPSLKSSIENEPIHSHPHVPLTSPIRTFPPQTPHPPAARALDKAGGTSLLSPTSQTTRPSPSKRPLEANVYSPDLGKKRIKLDERSFRHELTYVLYRCPNCNETRANTSSQPRQVFDAIFISRVIPRSARVKRFGGCRNSSV